MIDPTVLVCVRMNQPWPLKSFPASAATLVTIAIAATPIATSPAATTAIASVTYVSREAGLVSVHLLRAFA